MQVECFSVLVQRQRRDDLDAADLNDRIAQNLRWQESSAKKDAGAKIPSSSIPVQRPTNNISFHVRPSGGTCINDSDEFGATVHSANTNRSFGAQRRTRRQNSPVGAGSLALRALRGQDSLSHLGCSSHDPATRIARITALVVLDDRLKYVSALRSAQRGPSSVHSAAEVGRDSIVSLPRAPAKKPPSGTTHRSLHHKPLKCDIFRLYATRKMA